MSNTINNIIQIKRGNGAPGNNKLMPYELGYDKTNRQLYIGTEDGMAINLIPEKVVSAINADQLSTARSIQTNLGSTAAVSFNGTENVTPGVSGILSLANGGLGVNASTDAGKTTARANLGITLANLNGVPTTRKINNKALSADITLTAADVSAVPTSRTVNGKALSSNISLTAADVGALASDGITGGASTIVTSNLAASRALVSNKNGKVAVSAVTSTELGRLDGVTDNIQTQLNTKISNLVLLVSDFALTTDTTTMTLTDAGYKAFVIMGHMNNLTSTADDRGYVSLVIPSDMINVGESNALLFSLSGTGDAKYFIVYKSSTASNSTITFKNKGYYGAGVADNSMRIYGLK